MRSLLLLAAALAVAIPGLAQDVGRLKVARGEVRLERDGQRLPAGVGMPVRAGDVVVTGDDGAAGITFADDCLVSLGPRSAFAVDRYRFDPATHEGEFQGSLRRGKLAAVSGRMVRQAPESMRIVTPSSVMAVRGTEFAVQVDEPADASPGKP